MLAYIPAPWILWVMNNNYCYWVSLQNGRLVPDPTNSLLIPMFYAGLQNLIAEGGEVQA